jgi:hypothetical protein
MENNLPVCSAASRLSAKDEGTVNLGAPFRIILTGFFENELCITILDHS